MKPTLPFQREWSSQGVEAAVDPRLPLIGSPQRRTQRGQCIDAEAALEVLLKAERIGAARGGDEGSMGYVMDKDGEAVEVAAADPQFWKPRGSLVPGSRCARVLASACSTFESVGEFFRCHLPAEVEKQAWALNITAFLDYVAVGMKVEVHRDAAADSHTVVVFQHISQDDLVLFSRVCSLAIDYLSTSGLQVSDLGGVRCPPPMLSDDGFEGDLCQLEDEWPVMLQSAFEAMRGIERSMREQGVQALARWAELRRDCLPVLADALMQHGRLVRELLQGPLAEGYPLAVALKFASRCPQEAERLAEKILPLLPWPNSALSALVVRELQETFKSLITAAGAGTCKSAEGLEESPEIFAEGFSPTSTCTGDLWGSSSSCSRSESSKSSTWDSQKSNQVTQWMRQKSETLVLSEGEDDFTGDFI